jgi:hypothetical protein
VLIYGGIRAGGAFPNNGVRYDPAKDTWKAMAGIPGLTEGRHAAGCVWTGTRLIVFGGESSPGIFLADGASYDPGTDTWSILPASPLAARRLPAAVWSTTTHEALYSGGLTQTDPLRSDGAAFNPETNTWTMLPPAPLEPRVRMASGWTGSRMLLWGGDGFDSTGGPIAFTNGALFDPKTKAWKVLSAPAADFAPRSNFFSATGGRLFVFGGEAPVDGSFHAFGDGATWSEAAGGTWSGLPKLSAATVDFPERAEGAAWTDGARFWFWGGRADGAPDYPKAGASFDSVTGTWSAIDDKGAPAGRSFPNALWLGDQAFVYGGLDASGSPPGGLYVP